LELLVKDDERKARNDEPDTKEGKIERLLDKKN
jgi:hypothetical protein